ncbi:MAG: hypothetical protein ACU83O_10055 [Gammaproteobacteria bacterium]
MTESVDWGMRTCGKYSSHANQGIGSWRGANAREQTVDGQFKRSP